MVPVDQDEAERGCQSEEKSCALKSWPERRTCRTCPPMCQRPGQLRRCRVSTRSRSISRDRTRHMRIGVRLVWLVVGEEHNAGEAERRSKGWLSSSTTFFVGGLRRDARRRAGPSDFVDGGRQQHRGDVEHGGTSERTLAVCSVWSRALVEVGSMRRAREHAGGFGDCSYEFVRSDHGVEHPRHAEVKCIARRSS